MPVLPANDPLGILSKNKQAASADPLGILKKNDGQPLETGGQGQPASTSPTQSQSQSSAPEAEKTPEQKKKEEFEAKFPFLTEKINLNQPGDIMTGQQRQQMAASKLKSDETQKYMENLPKKGQALKDKIAADKKAAELKPKLPDFNPIDFAISDISNYSGGTSLAPSLDPNAPHVDKLKRLNQFFGNDATNATSYFEHRQGAVDKQIKDIQQNPMLWRNLNQGKSDIDEIKKLKDYKLKLAAANDKIAANYTAVLYPEASTAQKGIIKRKLSGDPSVYDEIAFKEKGIPLTQDQEFNNEKQGIDVEREALQSDYKDKDPDDIYYQRSAQLDDKETKLINQFPDYRKKQVGLMIAQLAAEDPEIDASSRLGFIPHDLDQKTIDYISKTYNQPKELFEGITYGDIPSISIRNIPAKIATDAAASLVNAGVRIVGSALGVESDRLSYLTNKISNIGSSVYGDDPYGKTSRPESIIDINPTSSTYLQSISNPKAGKTNYNLTTTSHAMVEGAAQFATFIGGLKLATKGVQATEWALMQPLTAEAEQSAAMSSYMILTNYENNHKKAEEVLGKDASEIGKGLYATAMGYIDKLAFDVLPKDKLFLGTEAKEALGKELSPLIKNLTVKDINKELLQTKVQKAITGIVNTAKEVGHITAATSAAEVSKGLINSMIGQGSTKQYMEDAWQGVHHTLIDTPLAMAAPLGLMEFVNMKSNSSFFKENVYNSGLESNKYITIIQQELGKGNITKEEANSRMEVIKVMRNIVQSTPDVNPKTGQKFTHEQQVDYAYNRLRESALRAKALDTVNDPAISAVYLADAQDLADVRKAMLESFSKKPKEPEIPQQKTIPQQKVDIERQRQDELEKSPEDADKINIKYDAEITKLSEQEQLPSEKPIEEIIPQQDLNKTQSIIDRVTNNESINEGEIKEAEDILYTALENNPNSAHLIEPLIQKLQSHENITKTETVQTTERKPIEGTLAAKRKIEIKPALEQSEGSTAKVILADGTAGEGTLRIKDGNYVLEVEGQEPIVIGEKQITDRDLKIPEGESPVELDENGNVKSATFETKNGHKVTITDPEKALDLGIQLSLEAVGEIPDEAFDKVYEDVIKEDKIEVPVEKPKKAEAEAEVPEQKEPEVKPEDVDKEKKDREDTQSKLKNLSDEKFDETKKKAGFTSRDTVTDESLANEYHDALKVPEPERTEKQNKIVEAVNEALGTKKRGKVKKAAKGKAAMFVAEHIEEPTDEGEGTPKPAEEGEPVGAVPTQTHTVETIDQVDTTGFNEVQNKNISDIKRVLQAITKFVGKDIGKKLKVVIHSTRESAAKAAYDSTIKAGGTEAEARENMQNQGNRGWWTSADGEIHLNMAEVSSETGFHEGTHPILDAIAKIKPEAIDQFHKQLEALPQGKEIIDLAKDNYAEYDSQGNVTNSLTVKNEAITDYIAKVADGQIKIDKSNFEKVKDYVVNLLTKLGIMPEKDIRSINDLRKLAQMVSEKFAKGQEIEIKDAESYVKKAENLNTSEGIDSDLNVDDIKGESGRGIVLSKKKDILDDDTIKAVKTSIINYKSIPKLKISRTLFYDNTRVGNLEIKNRNTGYAPKVVGKGGFFYSYMPESLKNKAVLAFTSVNQAIQTLKRQMLYPNSVQAIAAQNFLTAHLGNKSTLKALFGEQGSKQLGIFQDAVKKNPEGEKELLNSLIESTISVANQKVQSGVNEGKSTNSAIEIKKIIDRNGGNLDNIKSLNDFRDKVLTFKGGDSFGARNILFTEIFQEKPTKITKSTRDSHQIIHYKYGIPTLSEIAEGNNQKQLNNAETGDVIKMVKPYSDPIVYTTDANIYKQYSENPTPEMVENGIKIELLPKEASHESYAFVLKGENVGILDNYIAAPQLYEQNEKIAKVAKKQSFYNVGRMPSDAAPGEYPSEPIPQGVPQFSKTRKPIEWEESKEGKGDPSISARNPIVQEAAAKLKEGKITNEEYRAVASENSPIRPITRFFEPATEDRIKSALSEDKIDKVNIPVEDGKEVGLRLDIPAYKNNNTWVVSVHEGTTNAGKAISYTNVAKIKDVNFGVEPKAALAIAAGVPKTTIGRMFGKWENIEGDTLESKGENAKKIVQDIVNDPNYVQVGMNPFRHSYFYDRSSDIGRPIKSAEEVIQVGGLVYAKKPVYGDWTDEAYRVKGLLDAGQKPIQFSKTKLPQQKEEVKGTLDGKPVTFVKQPDNVEVVDGFYSPIEKRLTETKIDKQSANKWREIVGKGDEAKFTGVLGWLESLPPTQQVSKSEIQNWMKGNRIEINEVVKGKQSKNYKLKSNPPEDLGINRNDALDILSKAEDLDNPRLPEFMERRYGKSGEDILNWLKENTEEIGTYSKDTKYETYQLPGEKTNYKEVLITIPSKTNETRLQELIQKKRDKTITEQEETEFQKLDKKLEGNFQSSHYDEPNILAHIRMNTRVDAEGNKVLHIEEFQSDWGQKGKKEGFGSKEKELQIEHDKLFEQANKADSLVIAEMREIRKEKPNASIASELTAGNKKLEKLYLDYRVIEDNRLAVLRKMQDFGNKIPEAPFVTKTADWAKLAWKVALKEAVKEGADKITWTTGEQQNERYDLSKQVDEIRYNPNKKLLRVTHLKGSQDVFENVSEKEMENIIGKDIANKVLTSPTNENGLVIIKGDGLKIGGSGMKGFYGSPSEGKLGIVGEVAKSLFKQEPNTTEINQSPDFVKQKLTVVNEPNEPMGRVWLVVSNEGEVRGRFSSKEEATQEKIRMQKQREDAIKTSTQHSIDITPEMKSQVESGMPMFSKTKDKKISDMKGILKEYVDEGKSLEEIKDIMKEEFGDYYKDVEGIIDQAHQEMTTTGIKNAVTERERAERGLAEVEVEAKRSFGKVFDTANEMINNKDINGLTLAAEIVKNPRPLKAEESAVLLIDRMRISKEYNKKNAELLEAQDKGETNKADIIQSQMEALEQEMDLNDEAARKSGYEQGLGLAARRMLIAQDYSLVTQMNRLKTANGGEEVPKQYQERIKDLVTKLEEANKKLEDFEKKQIGTKKQSDLANVKPVSRTPEQVVKEKQNIKSKIVSKWGQTLARMKAATGIKRSVAPIPITPEKQAQLESIVKDVNDMVKLYAEGGETSLKKIIDNIHQDLVGEIPDLNKSDVEDMVLGKYDTEKVKTPLTKEKIEALANVRKVKTEIDLLKEELKNKQRGGVEKAVDYLHGWHRFAILSGVPSAAKIGTAALTRGIVTRAENIVGQALALIPGIRKIAKQAPREGGISRSAEAKAFTTWFDKMTREDIRETMKTGLSSIDYLYGKKDPMAGKVPEWMEFFGRMHSAVKLLPKRAEFFRSLEMRTEHALKNGKDINDPMVQQEMATAAYNDAIRSIFMQDNIVSDAYKSLVSNLEREHPAFASAAKLLFPIVKVPVNYVAEQVSYLPPIAAIKAITTLYKGRKGMTPEQSDYFMRAIKKGAIGTAFIFMGYMNPQALGGYYTGRRKKDDLEAGDIELFGTKLPHFMVHTPLLEMLQVGATMRRAVDAKIAKGEEPSKLDGIPTIFKGELTQVPFIGTGERAMKLLDNKTMDGLKDFGNSMVQSIAEPQLMQNIAEWTDRQEGEQVKRKPSGIVEKLESGIPGLRQKVKEDQTELSKKESEKYDALINKGVNIPNLNTRQSYKVDNIDGKHPQGVMTEDEYSKFVSLVKKYREEGWINEHHKHEGGISSISQSVYKIKEKHKGTEKVKGSELSKEDSQTKVNEIHDKAIQKAKEDLGLVRKKKTRRTVSEID